MFTTVVLLVLLSQDVASLSPESGMKALETLSPSVNAEREKKLFAKAQARQVALKEKEFVDRFNALVEAMGQFSVSYRSKHAIDAKTVESIRKAYRDLERADPWFRVQE